MIYLITSILPDNLEIIDSEITQTTIVNFGFSKILLSDLYSWLCISFDTQEQFTNFNGELHMFVAWFNKSKILQSHLQTDIWSSLSWTICPSRSRLTHSITTITWKWSTIIIQYSKLKSIKGKLGGLLLISLRSSFFSPSEIHGQGSQRGAAHPKSPM